MLPIFGILNKQLSFKVIIFMLDAYSKQLICLNTHLLTILILKILGGSVLNL